MDFFELWCCFDSGSHASRRRTEGIGKSTWVNCYCYSLLSYSLLPSFSPSASPRAALVLTASRLRLHVSVRPRVSSNRKRTHGSRLSCFNQRLLIVLMPNDVKTWSSEMRSVFAMRTLNTSLCCRLQAPWDARLILARSRPITTPSRLLLFRPFLGA